MNSSQTKLSFSIESILKTDSKVRPAQRGCVPNTTSGSTVNGIHSLPELRYFSPNGVGLHPFQNQYLEYSFPRASEFEATTPPTSPNDVLTAPTFTNVTSLSLTPPQSPLTNHSAASVEGDRSILEPSFVRSPFSSLVPGPEVRQSQQSELSGRSPTTSIPEKNSRMNYSNRQVRRLEDVFSSTPYPDAEMYESLTEELNLPTKKLKTWFQNRRARNKRQKTKTDVRFSPIPNFYITTGAMPVQPHYPYGYQGVMMTQPGALMTPPSSPLELQHFLFPSSMPPMMPSGAPQ